MTKKKAETLNELLRDTMFNMSQDDEFEKHDLVTLSEMLDKFTGIEELKLKPHLITIHENMWHMHLDFVDNALEILGYECVGRMNDMCEDNYNFGYDDKDYDTLYRFKDKNCDYTTHLKFKDF